MRRSALFKKTPTVWSSGPLLWKLSGDELQLRARNLELDQDRVRQTANNLKKERDELRERAMLLETIWDEVRERTPQPETELDPIVQSRASSDGSPECNGSCGGLGEAAEPFEKLARKREMQPGTFALLNEDGDESGYGWNLLHDPHR